MSATIIALPTAASVPIANPRWRGRYPSTVTPIPWRVRHPRVGSTVIVTSSTNYGIKAKIVGYRQGGRYGASTFELESLGRPFRGLKFTESGEPAPDDNKASFGRADFRVSYQSSDQRSDGKPEQYSLPIWPARWEKALAKMYGSAKR